MAQKETEKVTFHIETRLRMPKGFNEDIDPWAESWVSTMRQPITDKKVAFLMASRVFEDGAGIVDVRIITSKGNIVMKVEGSEYMR